MCASGCQPPDLWLKKKKREIEGEKEQMLADMNGYIFKMEINLDTWGRFWATYAREEVLFNLNLLIKKLTSFVKMYGEHQKALKDAKRLQLIVKKKETINPWERHVLKQIKDELTDGLFELPRFNRIELYHNYLSKLTTILGGLLNNTDQQIVLYRIERLRRDINQTRYDKELWKEMSILLLDINNLQLNIADRTKALEITHELIKKVSPIQSRERIDGIPITEDTLKKEV